MTASATQKPATKTLHRPKASTVFAAAFLAGAAAAVAVNRAFDVHLAQSVPQVESETIFVALRSLPKGSPVNIYDVALKPWPTAMMPATALRADATFENMVLRHPVQEGQPILSLQLAEAQPESQQHYVSSPPPAAETTPVRHRSQATPPPAFVPYSTTAPIPVAPAPNQQAAHRPTAPVANQPEQTEPKQAEPVKQSVEPAIQPTPATATLAADNTPQPAHREPTPVEAEPATADAAPVTPAKPSQFAAAEAKPVVETAPQPAETSSTPVAAAEQTAPAAAVAASENTASQPVPVEKAVELEAAAPAESVASVAETAPSEREPASQPESVSEPEAMVASLPAAAAEQVAEEPVETKPEPTTTAVAEPGPPPVATTPTPAPKSVEPIDVTASVLARADSQPAAGTEQPTATLPSSLPSLGGSQAGPTPAGQQPMRYLVVPERIALQVDHSFTRRPAPQTTSPTSAARQNEGVKPLPNATARSRTTSRPTPAAPQRNADSRPGQPSQQMQATAGSVPRANRPAGTTSRPTSQQTASKTTKPVEEPEPRLRALFPNISAGLSAMSQEWRDFRNRSNEPEPEQSGSRQAQRQGNQQPRSASRPQQAR